MPLGTRNCAFLTPITLVNLKYVTRKSAPSLKLLNFHVSQAFDSKSRIVYVAALVSVVWVWVLIEILTKKRRSGTVDFVETILVIISIHSSTSAHIKKFKSLHHRILIAVLLISALIMCNTFQGLIVRTLTEPTKSNDIDTLEELLRRNLKLSAMVLIPNLFKPNHDGSNVNQIQKQIYSKQTPNLVLDFEKIGKVDEKNAILSKIPKIPQFESNFQH
jgi:hypothetical protein